jgi:hypothetical protein
MRWLGEGARSGEIIDMAREHLCLDFGDHFMPRDCMAKLLKRFLLIPGAVAIIAANLETSVNATKSGTAYNVGTVSMDNDRTLIFDLNVGIWNNGPTTVAVELIYPANSSSYRTMKKLAGDIQLGQTKPLPPWSDYVGIVTMAENRTVTFSDEQ